MAVGLIHGVNAALRPQLTALAEAKLRGQLTHISDEAVAQALDGAELVAYRCAPGESVGVLSTDTARLNALRGRVLEVIVHRLEELDSHCLDVPLGAVTGVDLFSAIGPDIPVRVLSVAAAEGSFRNDFLTAGINQTLHRIYLDITVTAKVLLPGGTVDFIVTTPVCAAETVIIGQVPQTFLTLRQ